MHDRPSSRPLRSCVCAPGGCEAGCANKLLGCSTSKPTNHPDPPVMHGTDRREWAVFGAFGGWAQLRRARRWLGGSRDRGGLRALAGCPGGLECLPGLKRTAANLRSCQLNVFARLEVQYQNQLVSALTSSATVWRVIAFACLNCLGASGLAPSTTDTVCNI